MEAERDRDEAFRFITHDIRSPLSSIISLIEYHNIQFDNSNTAIADDQNIFKRIQYQAINALKLTDDFVHLLRSKSGSYLLRPVNLSDLLIEVIDDLWPQAKLRSITVQVDLPEESWVIADSTMLKRALTNLLSNSIKFSPVGASVDCRISESIETDTKHHQNVYWNISFSDNGPGISLEDRANLFQPFMRFHDTSHPEITGTGLGLAFVYNVAVKLHGKVTLDSQTDGSIFHLYLPKVINL